MFYTRLVELYGYVRSRKYFHSRPLMKRFTRRLAFLQLEERRMLTSILGTAETFAVLGGSTVTNTGPSVITGNLGVSPGAAIVGFPPGVVTAPATIHAADAVALQAQSDVTTAFNNLAGRASNFNLTGQDLGGLTLIPGVYTFATSAQLTGALTLDAQGNSNAEFIFQIGSTITTASNASVHVINGADSCNVYWEVGSSATLGTNTAFLGNILAVTSITLNTNATILNGRALAQNGAVTLDSNQISVDGCSSISGRKINDLNGDGILQPGEPGLAGVTVFLDTNLNGLLDPGEVSTTTDVNGNYTFGDLFSGTYRVRESPQAGLLQTTANPTDTVLTPGQTVTGVNFGDFQQVSIGGLKFNDLNGNGVRDLGDPGLAGVTVFLDTNLNGTLDLGEVSAVTDVSGNYSFTNLGPGTYRVREVPQVGSTQTTGNPADIVASSGNNISGLLFGNFLAGFQLISIGGLKFNDLNGNGTRDLGDPGLAGVTIFLDTNLNGTLDLGEVSTVTDVSGNYSFANLGPGTYRVREVPQVGSTQTTSNPADIVASSGNNISGVSFGNFQHISIAGLKFNDLNNNGVRDLADPGLAGVTVFLDTNLNGTLDPGELFTVTDVGGNYSFPNLGPGTYRVREVPQVGSTQTTSNPADIVASSGSNISSVLFGNFFAGFQLISITGLKFNDLNSNGSRDPGDPGLAGVTVFLDTNLNGTLDLGERSTVTDVNGNYSFVNLGLGTYRVREVPQVGSTQTTSNPADIVASSGNNISGVNFGNFLAGFQLISIGGLKFNDLNSDGVREAGEPGLAGVTVFLDTNLNGLFDLGEVSTVTDASGNYSFANLGPGSYRVREVPQAGATQTTSNPADIVASSGNNISGVNFGNHLHSIIVIGVGKNPNTPQLVTILDETTGMVLRQFAPYGNSFQGGVRVATGDLTGDGIDEIVTAPGWSIVAQVNVYSQIGSLLTTFQPYGASFESGVQVAVADVDGDGLNDIITVPSFGPAEVKVFRNVLIGGVPTFDTAHPYRDFLAFPASFIGGAVVAAADMGSTPVANGPFDNTQLDHKAEIVVGSSAGIQTTVVVFDASRITTLTPNATATPVASFTPFTTNYQGGVSLSVARINADLIPDIVVGAGVDGSSLIDVWAWNNTANAALSSLSANGIGFAAFTNPSRTAPVQVTTLDTNGDHIADTILAVQGPGGTTAQIRSFNILGVVPLQVSPFTVVPGIYTAPYFIATIPNPLPAVTSRFSQIGTALTITGTSENDTLVFSVSNTTLTIAINGVTRVFDTATVSSITYDAGAGNDIVTISTLSGSNVAQLFTNSMTVSGAGYTLAISNIENKYFFGRTSDQAEFYDTPGNDTFYGLSGYSILSGAGYFNESVGVGTNYGFSSGGTDTAILSGSSANDTFSGLQTYSILSGVNYFIEAVGYQAVYAFAGVGGSDSALFYDSPGNDTYYALNGTSIMSYGSRFTESIGFNDNYAFSSAGSDVAIFYDSTSDDTFYGLDSYSIMSHSGYINESVGFSTNYAFSSLGGNDVALLYGTASNDQFIGLPAYSILSGPTYFNEGIGFKQVYGFSGGGSDTASLYDSVGNDSLVSFPTYAVLSGIDFMNEAVGFPSVAAYASNGGVDTAMLIGSSGNDTFIANPTQVTFSGVGYYLQANSFDRVYANAGLGGTDTATLFDSIGNDTFTGYAGYSSLAGTNFFYQATGYGQVIAAPTTGGNDLAQLYDSAGDDTLTVAGSQAQLQYPASQITLNGYDRVVAKQSQGGINRINRFAINYVLQLVGTWI